MVGKEMTVRRSVVVLAGVVLMVASVALAPVAGAASAAPRAHPSATSALPSAPASAPAAGTVSTFARNFVSPTDLIEGPDTNLWFRDQRALFTADIGRFDANTGTVTLFSGSGMVSPEAPIVGPDGNIWFADNGANAIGRINVATGVIAMFTSASIDNPSSLISGPDGRLWFSNDGSNSIARITTSGTLTRYTAIPAGVVGAGPDGNIWVARTGSITKLTTSGVVKGTFTDASIDTPGPLVTGSDGNLWFVNSPIHGTVSIGTVTLAGAVSSFTDPSIIQPFDLLAGPDNALWFLNGSGIGSITTTGVVSSYSDPSFTVLDSLTVGPDANLWAADAGNNSIDMITTAGVVTVHTAAGNGPGSITTGPEGELWFSNLSSIGSITTGGFISGFLGNEVFDPNGIATGSDGNIWFTNGANAAAAPNTSPVVSVARMTPSGTLTIFADPALSDPGPIVAGPDGNLWFVDRGHDQLDSITTAGVITEPATLDGTPTALAVGPDDALWVTLAGSDVIDRVSTTGTVTPFTDPQIDGPTSITAGPDGALWFTNQSSDSIGRITTAGVVTHFSGTPIVGPTAITTGPDGALWFTQSGSVGRITTAGVVSTFASPAVSGGGIATGSDGNLWFTSPAVGPSGTPVARVTPAGVVTAYGSGSWGAQAIAAGPAGTMWFPNPADNSVSSVTTGNLGDAFHAVSPTRILDSRPGGGNIGGYTTPWGQGVTRDVTVAGVGGVPPNADAVVLNVTVTGATSSSFLSVYPSGAAPPTVSDLNFGGGQTIANQVTVKVGASGKVSIFNNGGHVDVIADVTGYYSSATGDGFTSLTPARILDSRPGVGNTGGFTSPWGPGLSPRRGGGRPGRRAGQRRRGGAQRDRDRHLGVVVPVGVASGLVAAHGVEHQLDARGDDPQRGHGEAERGQRRGVGLQPDRDRRRHHRRGRVLPARHRRALPSVDAGPRPRLPSRGHQLRRLRHALGNRRHPHRDRGPAGRCAGLGRFGGGQRDGDQRHGRFVPVGLAPGYVPTARVEPQLDRRGDDPQRGHGEAGRRAGVHVQPERQRGRHHRRRRLVRLSPAQ